MKTNEDSIVRCISVLYRYGQSYLTKRMEILNIGSGQYVFLMMLYHKDGISQEELSCSLKIDKGTTAKAIKKLEDEGYVVRKIDMRDKRAYKVNLTPKALKVIPTIQETAKEWEKIITSGFSEEEIPFVKQIMQRMAGNAYNFKLEDEEI